MRGAVKSKGLTRFANSCRAGGAPLDLDAHAAAGDGTTAATVRKALIERISGWHVARQQRRNAA